MTTIRVSMMKTHYKLVDIRNTIEAIDTILKKYWREIAEHPDPESTGLITFSIDRLTYTTS